jgi:DNA-binding IclR family transcriptional regulator
MAKKWNRRSRRRCKFIRKTSMHDPSVKMVDRIASILRVLSNTDDRGIPLAEVCALTQMTKTTAHRVLGALVDAGLLFQDILTRNYRLGFTAAVLGRSALQQDVSGTARPSLQRVAQKTGDTAFASVLEGTAAICVAREVGDFPIRTLTLSVGDRRPLGVGAGSLALLASLSDSAIENVLRRNEVWLRDFHSFGPANLRRLIARTRKDGFALNEGFIVPGMNAIGVVVLDRDGQPRAALTVAAIKDRMSRSRITELVGVLQTEARIFGELLNPFRLAAE